MELEAFKEVQNRRSEGSKPHSTPLTLAWLEENYELAEGVCIPRSSLYLHYLDFCEKTDTIPVNAASFGKIIRQQFSQLTTRRLGTRGQSKYHYYGIAIKEASAYYEAMYSKKGASGIGSESAKKDAARQSVAYSPRSKLGTLLPEFPSIKDINLPSHVPESKVSTFIMMYRTHCQRILDTVIRANFDEVQNYLLHFWQGMPAHMISILGSNAVVNIVGVCDSILYKAIAGVLMPSVLQALPDSLTQVIRKFAFELIDWLEVALDNLPETLRMIKFRLSKRFSELLKQQTSLNHLCQASKTVIHSSDIVSQMLEDWELVDFHSILQQTIYTMGDEKGSDIVELINTFYQEFEHLLDEQSPIESYTEWLDSMINRCIVMPSTGNSIKLRKLARCFLLNWSCISTRIIRDLTLHSAPSFGSFHLMHLMLDDYVMYRIEIVLAQTTATELTNSLKNQTIAGFQDNQEEHRTSTTSNTYHPSFPQSHFTGRHGVDPNELNHSAIDVPTHSMYNLPLDVSFNRQEMPNSVGCNTTTPRVVQGFDGQRNTHKYQHDWSNSAPHNPTSFPQRSPIAPCHSNMVNGTAHYTMYRQSPHNQHHGSMSDLHHTTNNSSELEHSRVAPANTANPYQVQQQRRPTHTAEMYQNGFLSMQERSKQTDVTFPDQYHRMQTAN